ncbi:hypothetical protein HHK36_012805 [Tetracentron sinense]|uniref:Uncharacterized protein n=1 Tax=Tetracentron sinense TaxID=13715 RepID=A0A834ZB15_TETSI|nr:hypothetical protein HHK36_012805 [Tetracentron sinense]
MGFFSFLGRVLFASLFILSAWQISKIYYGLNGHFSAYAGFQGKFQFSLILEFNEFGVDGGPAAKTFIPKYNVATEHVYSRLGVQVPVVENENIVAAIIGLKGIGGILFVFGSTFGAYLLLLLLAFTTPILYDFYNYDTGKPEFDLLLVEFLQSVALFGALLFFLDMKNSIPRRQLKKKAPKTKTG